LFVCARVKGQKNHFLCLSAFALVLEESWSRLRPKVKKTFSRFVFNVKAWGSEMGSKVEKHWFFRLSTVKNALYTSEYHAQNMWTNQIQEPWKLTNQIHSHPELSFSYVFVRSQVKKSGVRSCTISWNHTKNRCSWHLTLNRTIRFLQDLTVT